MPQSPPCYSYIYILHCTYRMEETKSSKNGYLLAGDDFVSLFCSHQRTVNEVITINGTTVGMRGIPGASISKLRRYLASLPPDACRAIMLSIGGNDLCNGNISPYEVVEDLLDLARMLVSNGTKFVFIFELLHRGSECNIVSRSLAEYNDAVNVVNTLLKQKCDDNILYWRHDNGMKGRQHRCQDQILPNKQALRSFRRRVIAAFSFQLHH